jgi:hypothetical protein
VRKFSSEEWIGIACIIIVALFLLYVMTGCSAQKKEAYSVDLIKGCHIRVIVADAEAAGAVSETIRLADCEISHTEDKKK